MIQLTPAEVKWIKLCKNHYQKDMPKEADKTWLTRLAWMFESQYGWSPEEFRNDFIGCIFNKLLDIWLKIEYDLSGNSNELRELFGAAFGTRIFHDKDTPPIERVINQLCSSIAFTTVILEDGTHRFNLDE